MKGSCFSSRKSNSEDLLLAGFVISRRIMEGLISASPAYLQVTTSCKYAKPHTPQLPHVPHCTCHLRTVVYLLCSWFMEHLFPSERKSHKEGIHCSVLRPQSRAWHIVGPPYLFKEGINAISLSLLRAVSALASSACKTLWPTPSLMPSDGYTAN